MMVEETDRRAMLQRVFIAKEPTVVLEGCGVRFPAPLADAQIESGHLIRLREQPSPMDDGRVIEALGALAAWQDRCDAVYPAWFVT